MAPRRFPILFITQSRIGDAVLSSGLVKALVDEVEDARFTIVAERAHGAAVRRGPGLERVIVMRKAPGRRPLAGPVAARCACGSWGLVVDLRGSAAGGDPAAAPARGPPPLGHARPTR